MPHIAGKCPHCDGAGWKRGRRFVNQRWYDTSSFCEWCAGTGVLRMYQVPEPNTAAANDTTESR